MKFRLASDIHSEFYDLKEMSQLARETLPPLEDDVLHLFCFRQHQHHG